MQIDHLMSITIIELHPETTSLYFLITRHFQ